MPGHPPSTVTGQSPDFPGEPSQTSARSLPDSEAHRDINPSTHHDKPTQFQEGAPAKAPMAPYPPNGVPPQPVVSASLDDEWVAAQNESQEEVGPTLSTTQADAKGQPWFPPGTSHLPNPNTPPIDWNLSRQQTSAPAKEDQGTLQANLEEHGNHNPPHTSPQKPDSQSPPSHDPGKGLPTEVMSGIHVVQNWPSTPSHKHSRRNGQGLSMGLRSDVQHATEASVEESEPFGADWSADEGLGPFRLRHPTFTGKGRTLFGIFTTNTVWTILSLGIYSFWGRVNIRRYLHSQTKFAGARFAFHGTGGELLLGWLKALGVFGTPYLGLHYLSIQHTEAISQWSLYGLAGFLVVCLLPTAIVGSHRYRMSRTSWRSIRFSFRASILSFTGLYLKGALLSLLTLGIYYPTFEHARRAFLTSGTHFGNQAFKFDGDPKSLGQLYFKAFRRLVLTLVIAEVFLLGTSFLATHFRPNQVVDLVFLSTVGTGIILAPFLLGLWFWFQAAKQRFMWNHTTFGPGRFRATMKGRDLFELKCTNFILLIFSLGLAWPWVQKRNLQFQYYHLGYRGPLRLQHIVQQATSASPMGEELAGFFDAGFRM